MSTRNIILNEFNKLTCIKDMIKLEEYVDFCLHKRLSYKIEKKTASHHVLPRAKSLPFIQYSNFLENQWNKAELYYYDHYYAHYLLYLAIDHHSICYAFCSMHTKDIKNGRLESKDLISEDEFTKIYQDRNKKSSNDLKSLVEFEGKLITKASRQTTINMRNRTTESLERASERIRGDKNPSKNAKVIKSIRNTKLTTLINGKNLDTISAERAAETMKKEFINEEGITTTIYKNNGRKLSKHLNTEIILEDGTKTTVSKIKARKKGDKMIENGNFYNVYNVFDPSYNEVLSAIKVGEISPGLEKKTKDNFLGKSKFGQTVLKKKNKAHLIGLYVEKLH